MAKCEWCDKSKDISGTRNDDPERGTMIRNEERGSGTRNEDPERGTSIRNEERVSGTRNEDPERGPGINSVIIRGNKDSPCVHMGGGGGDEMF